MICLRRVHISHEHSLVPFFLPGYANHNHLPGRGVGVSLGKTTQRNDLYYLD